MNITDHLTGNIGWKDSSLRYLGCNSNLSYALNLESPEASIGLRDCDILAQSEADVAFHLQKDLIVLQGQTLQYLHFTHNVCYFVSKKPLLNSTQQIAGIIFHCQVLQDPNLIPKPFPATTNPCHKPYLNPYLLSKRELQCLSYILHGVSSKQIADALELSKRTIDFYIENVKNKMGCLNKAELIVTAIRSGYGYMLEML